MISICDLYFKPNKDFALPVNFGFDLKRPISRYSASLKIATIRPSLNLTSKLSE
jgi:hypothetical protein